MTAIRQEDLMQSVADAPPFISYYPSRRSGMRTPRKHRPRPDAEGSPVQESGAREEQQKIGKIPVTTV